MPTLVINTPRKIRVDGYATIVAGLGEAHSFQITDGFGRGIATASDHPGSVGGFSAQRLVYDVMGRVIKTSNPTETNASGDNPSQWATAGDDAAAGWIYTQQTYDWKGRPLVTTNPSITGNPAETTTREVTYSGCGCAGGEVATLTDEGTIVSGVPKRRQQKIYTDVLGRTRKTEVLNWDGTGPNGTAPGNTVYSATVTTYNVRDQVEGITQYVGPEGGSTFQNTTMTYDGFGRLKTQHRPEQQVDPNNSASADHTTWEYNPDETVQKIIDARGASQTFGYNNRGQLTGITYDAPAPIPTPSPVSFAYDASGNRISMTDGLGNVSYNYDSLSRLGSETRTFTGVGSFTLTYQYNLANQLTSFTDSYGAQVGYAYNSAGKLNAVNSSGFAGVSNYASGIQYRAWGGLKSMNYGNSRTAALSYNARLQIATYSVPGVAGSEYRYATLSGGTDNDGRVKFVRDLMQTNSPFDRSYSFDHVGRLTSASTASLARGGGYEQTGPYQEGFGYDAFGNMTSRGGLSWSTDVPNVTLSYTNNRNTAWSYDADGNGSLEDDMTWVHDAAGNAVFLRRPRTPGSSFVTTKDRVFDGDDNYIKEVVDGTAATYYVRSTVFGGEIVTNVLSNGEKQRGYVYALGGILAEQNGSQGGAQWLHSDPVTGNRRWTSGSGQIVAPNVQLDPLGVDAGAAEPPQGQPPGEPDRLHGHGEITNPSTGCGIDGIPAPCDLVIGVMNIGAARRCPNDDCRFAALSDNFSSRRRNAIQDRVVDEWQRSPQRDYAHNWGGLLPAGGTRNDRGELNLLFFPVRRGESGGRDEMFLNFFDPFSNTSQQQNTPQPCAIDVQIPNGGTGFILKSGTTRNTQFATESTILNLMVFAVQWHGSHPSEPLRIGEISQQGGGRFGQHRGSAHAEGRGVDIGLFRNDGQNLATSYQDTRNYNRTTVQALVTALDNNPDVKRIFFNDPMVTGKKLGRDTKGIHDNHIHVEFGPCYYTGRPRN